jgi:hypothetical protein
MLFVSMLLSLVNQHGFFLLLFFFIISESIQVLDPFDFFGVMLLIPLNYNLDAVVEVLILL